MGSDKKGNDWRRWRSSMKWPSKALEGEHKNMEGGYVGGGGDNLLAITGSNVIPLLEVNGLDV